MSGAKMTEAHQQKAVELIDHAIEPPGWSRTEWYTDVVMALDAAAEQARREEREACALIADQGVRDQGPGISEWIADCIRARTSEAPADEGTRTG